MSASRPLASGSAPTQNEAWLEARLADVPPGLAAAIRELAGGAEPEALADAAVAGLARVASAPADRARATELLAADALLTYAFEAAADVERGGSAAASLALAARVASDIGERLGEVAS